MTTAFPVSGGFIRLAGHFVDDAWGFMAGWNFFLYEAFSIPFEITATCTVLGFWVDDLPDAAVIATMVRLIRGTRTCTLFHHKCDTHLLTFVIFLIDCSLRLAQRNGRQVLR